MAQVQEVVDEVGATNGTAGPGTGPGSGRKPGTSNVAVDWNLRPASKLPERRSTGGFKNEKLDGILDQIRSTGSLHAQPFEIGIYAEDDRSQTSARAKASALRKRYPEAEGWVFRVGESENQPGSVALYAQYGG